MVETYQNERGIRAMILSLKAGGTGLNLTAASQVIHYDLWWNPAVEAQATDRAYRIGQQRTVLVHRLITENTFEEKIDAMIQAKKELADLSVASGEQWITELSDQQLRDLIALDAPRS
jgi:SNF2 family DNA or RNA helicase